MWIFCLTSRSRKTQSVTFNWKQPTTNVRILATVSKEQLLAERLSFDYEIDFAEQKFIRVTKWMKAILLRSKQDMANWNKEIDQQYQAYY